MPLSASIQRDIDAAGIGNIGSSGGVLAFDFTSSTIAAGAESADLVAAPAAGTFLQIVWIDWADASSAALYFAIMSEPSGTAIWVARCRTSAATINNYKPGIYLNINTAKAFRIKNLDGANALGIYFSFQYRIITA